jgi:hypothetical protein
MIETVSTSRATSAVAFLESMREKIELLMKAGDASDYKREPTNKAVVDCPKAEKKFLALAMKRRAQGLPWSKAAEGTPWNPDTLRALAIRRGLYVAPDRAREQRLKRAKLNAIAKKVNLEARRLGNLGKALANHPEITEDQYHAAKGRLGLPNIARRKP